MNLAARINIFAIARSGCLALFSLANFASAQQNTFTGAEADSINTFLRENFDGRNDCIVIGFVDANGSKVFGAGSIGNGTSNKVDGNTVFPICSVTKTFTALLLQEMADRGEIGLDDPAAKYLPKSVKLPARGGKEITLLNLATHTSGLPRDPESLSGADMKQ